MKCTAVVVVLALLSGAAAAEVAEKTMSNANPIRRVVNMLAMMQKKVTEEGKAETELFEKFMCYCKTGVGELEASISDAEAKLPQVISALKEAGALKEQLAAEIKDHKADRDDAEDAVAKAKALREKEAGVFSKEKGDYDSNIAAMTKAIAAIEKGAGGSFLQTKAAKRVQKLVIDMSMSDMDRDAVSSFLSQSTGEDYAPQSGQITGILKQMKDTMVSDLADMTKQEEASKASFADLMAAKKKEIDTNQKALESKLAREGEVGVEIETLNGDNGDTTKNLADDKKFLADLKKGCGTQQEAYDANMKIRGEELLAIGDTIAMLNDDDALELFKKTLPAPSLMQVQVSSKVMKSMALKALGENKMRDPRIAMIAMLLKGHTKGFEKVLKMIDNMVTLLGEEQVTDDDKKEYCEGALDKTEDELKVLEETIKDTTAAIKDGKAMVETTAKEIDDLTKAITDLDKQVKEATAIRKEENAEYEELVASNTAAKELLKMAKNRMAKFYAPKLYKPPAKEELSAAGRIEANMGGASFVQVRMHKAGDDAAPPPPPEAVGAYKKKTEEGNGIMTMMDMMIQDIDKELTEGKTEEDNAQEEYDELVAESKTKNADMSKSVMDKKAAKADMEGKLETMGLEKKATTKEAFGKTEQLGDLHGECDWLLQNFDSRKGARTGEIESLKNAKAVLSGANFSLMQTRRSSLRGSA
jgi:hypothetical protein